MYYRLTLTVIPRGINLDPYLMVRAFDRQGAYHLRLGIKQSLGTYISLHHQTTWEMSSPSHEHISTYLQRLRAACRIAIPLSRVPAHFSSTKYHPYSYKDCVDALEAWQALHLRSRPVRLRNEDDLRNWSLPVTMRKATIWR
jgi:hypothetical protein